MTVYATVRLAVFGISILFSLIVLGLAAHFTSYTNQFGTYFTFAAMSIACAVITLATVVPMLVIEFLRKGAFTSRIYFELGWLGFLWVLWLSAAGLSASANALFPSGCNYGLAEAETACREVSAVTAFTFLTWAALAGYFAMVLTLSLISLSRGNNVFANTVEEADFHGHNTATAPGASFAPGLGEKPYTPTQYPPQPQQQYPPAQPQYPQSTGTPTSQPSYPQV